MTETRHTILISCFEVLYFMQNDLAVTAATTATLQNNVSFLSPFHLYRQALGVLSPQPSYIQVLAFIFVLWI